MALQEKKKCARNFSPEIGTSTDFGYVLPNLTTTSRVMDKWMFWLDSASQKGGKRTLEGALIAVESCFTAERKCIWQPASVSQSKSVNHLKSTYFLGEYYQLVLSPFSHVGLCWDLAKSTVVVLHPDVMSVHQDRITHQYTNLLLLSTLYTFN